MSAPGKAPEGLAQRLPRQWFQRRLLPALWPLLPVSWLFRLLSGLRRRLFRAGFLASTRLPVPVVVVGNLTVGGAGKTPLTLWLATALRTRGWRPGIVSRGHGTDGREVRPVHAHDRADAVGDEPLLLARRSGVPVFIGRRRARAAQALLSMHPECNVILCDDGLQHYPLCRDAEIVVFDGRGAGNGRLLPAGPLREPLGRLASAHALVWNGPPDARVQARAGRLPQFAMRLAAGAFRSLHDPRRQCTAATLRGRRLHALAGIGDPARFFAQLAALGLDCETHPFPDHHAYTAADLAFARDGVLLMTEKDAVKCAAIPTGEAWYLPVEAEFGADGAALLDIILEKLHGRSLA